MTSWLLGVVKAIIDEGRQRYETACLIDCLRRDQRMLEDLGLSHAWLAAELRRGQRIRSPLRTALRRMGKEQPVAGGEAAHDF